MKEIRDIVNAFDNAARKGKKTALATVVHVAGSSYRRPGARMLVTEDGELTGAISGGCLEGDALRKAVLAITQEKKKLVIYDTTDEDDAKLGIQLGCNGIVSILFEPVNADEADNPIAILKKVIAFRKPAVLISSYSLNNGNHFGTTVAASIPQTIRQDILTLSNEVFNSGISVHTELTVESNQQHFFIEYYQPPIALIIIGAGNDAMPLAAMAQQVGWSVTIADGRSSHATAQRFITAEKVLVAKPNELIGKLACDERTAIALMTHNYNYDLEILSLLTDTPATYIGLLGPAAKRNRMFAELEKKGITMPDALLQKIYGPTGLDLGAETAEEIALSVLSEIMAVMNQKDPIHLRCHQRAIHHYQP